MRSSIKATSTLKLIFRTTMTNRIEKDFFFKNGLHFDNAFLINKYDLTLSITVETSVIREQNIAMERIDYFINDSLPNAVLLPESDKKIKDRYRKAKLKICTLPEQPYDQILSMVLLCKLNAIMEGRMIVTDLCICSDLSEGVRHTLSLEEVDGLINGKHWWNRADLSINDDCYTSTNIIKLFAANEWIALGLDWQGPVTKRVDFFSE